MKTVVFIILILELMLFYSCVGDSSPNEFPLVLDDTLEIEYGTFHVSVDKTSLENAYDQINVDVIFIANQDIHRNLHTSTFQEKGLIDVRFINKETNLNTFLYTDYFGIITNSYLLELHIKPAETVQRNITFSRVPFFGLKGYPTSPIGVYQLQIALYESNPSLMFWYDTDIFIEAL